MKTWKQGRCIAGLWLDDKFPVQLGWRRNVDQIPLPRPANYKAPSWSWVAVDGAISDPQANGYYRFDGGVRLLLELASLRTEPEGLDDFKALSIWLLF